MSSTIPNLQTAQTVAALLPKLHDADPDFRFMSLNDLFQVLTVGRDDLLHNDYNTAARTVDGIIKTLDDQNGEVQNLAIKWYVLMKGGRKCTRNRLLTFISLGPLVHKLPNTIIAPLIDKLSTLSTENSVDNSIPAMALRTVVITLARPVPGVTPSKDVTEAYSAISRVLIPRLVGHLVLPPPGHMKLPAPPAGMLQINPEKDLDAEAVDVLIEVVRCFGPMLADPEVAALQRSVLLILENERATSVVKKRAVIAVSILAVYLSEMSLSNFISHLIECFRNPHLTPVQRRLYITILGSMARSIPQRFGPHLQTLAPFVLSALSSQELEDQEANAAEDGEPDQEIDDVREAALVALEAFLSACGVEMRNYTEETIAAAIRFLKYDPNYVDQDDDDMGGTQSDDDDGDFGDDDEFEAEAGFDDDDDDASWKVRRCAAKVLYTLIGTRGSGDLLDDGTLYAQVAPILVSRFNEREENVRLEIISTMGSLIRKTGEGSIIHFSADDNPDYMSYPQGKKRRRESSTITFDTKEIISLSAGLTSPTIDPVPTSGPRADLAQLSPIIIKAVTKLLKGTAISSKQAVILLLENMVSVQHGGLSEYFSQIIDPLVDASKGAGMSTSTSTVITTGGAASATTGTLRIAALRLISDVAETHSSVVLQPYLVKIVPGVVFSVKDKFYKISGEAISTVEQLIKALTPPRSRSAGQKHQADIQKLYQVILNRVSANDADVEVRHRAIHALGILLARTATGEGSNLLSPAERSNALDLLKDRLKNETTRLSAVRAVDTVAALATSKDQLEPKWIREVSLELAAQLRKADRSLRGASLGALKNLIVTPAARTAIDKPTVIGLVSALLPLLTIMDLHLLGPALLVLAALTEDDPQVVVTDQLTVALTELLKAPLGGAVLDALLILVKNIGSQGVGAPLMSGLLTDVGTRGDPAVVGKVIGTFLVYGGATVGVSLDSFLTELKNATDEANKCLALAVLGEAGLLMGTNSPLKPSTFTVNFKSISAKINLAAAVALGRAGAGNVSTYLPVILRTMEQDVDSQYLLLHSIKEILQEAGNNPAEFSPFTKNIWDCLIAASRPEDNRAVGAECIGRLAILEPRIYMPQLQTYLGSKTPSVRAMAIQAIRYTLPDGDETFDAILRTILIDMLTVMMHDSDLENRRLALTTLNSASHNKPDLILPHLGQLVPLVMRESIVKPELVREVMMGPFKHKVDDGLELRKSAYETLYSLMETSFSRINTLDFYDRIIAGLSDEHDIRGLCNLMVTKLVVLDPDETARRLDAIAESFRTILSTKLKDNAVKQDIERQEEASKGVLRVSLQLHNAIPGASSTLGNASGQHQTWRTFWEWVEKDFEPQLRTLKDEYKTDGVV